MLQFNNDVSWEPVVAPVSSTDRPARSSPRPRSAQDTPAAPRPVAADEEEKRPSTPPLQQNIHIRVDCRFD